MALEFLRYQWEMFFRNAQSERDRRTQMRGSRAMLLFLGFTAILGIVTAASLADILDSGVSNLADLQEQFGRTKDLVWISLLTLICLIGPVLTSGTVVAEKIRRSSDLIDSSPISPVYFLVGKLIGAYRYLWALLLLSIPFSAATVVFGGSTAWDVLAFYWHISCIGLVFGAIGLLASCIAETTVKATGLAYLYSALLVGVMTALGQAFTSSFRGSSGTRGAIPSVLQLLSGNVSSLAEEQIGVQVQALGIFTAVVLLITSILVMGSVSAYVGRADRNTVALRVTALLAASVTLFATARSGALGTAELHTLPVGIMLFFFPRVACFGASMRQRTQRDGTFNWRQTLTGRPSGALPYLLLSFCCLYLPQVIIQGRGPEDWALAGYSFVMLVAIWAYCRWVSARSGSYSTAAGLSTMSLVFLFFVLPLIVSMVFLRVGGSTGISGGVTSTDFTPLGPYDSSNWNVFWTWTGFWIFLFASSSFVTRLPRAGRRNIPPVVKP